jgi:hypothetical protein
LLGANTPLRKLRRDYHPGMGLTDGDRWITERVASLRKLLKTDIPSEQRKAIEAEIALLLEERGLKPNPGWFALLPRWLRGRPREYGPGPD